MTGCGEMHLVVHKERGASFQGYGVKAAFAIGEARFSSLCGFAAGGAEFGHRLPALERGARGNDEHVAFSAGGASHAIDGVFHLRRKPGAARAAIPIVVAVENCHEVRRARSPAWEKHETLRKLRA